MISVNLYTDKVDSVYLLTMRGDEFLKMSVQMLPLHLQGLRNQGDQGGPVPPFFIKLVQTGMFAIPNPSFQWNLIEDINEAVLPPPFLSKFHHPSHTIKTTHVFVNLYITLNHNQESYLKMIWKNIKNYWKN